MNKRKTVLSRKLGLVLGILLAMLLNSIEIEVSAQTPIPTPPALISSRCSAYTAPTIPSPLRTRYINAASGNDSNDGLTPTTAWLTLSKANSSTQPGDLFLLRGTFTNQWINPANSGTAANKITYRKESGQTAVIEVGLFGGAIILQNGQSHIVIDGLEVKNVDIGVDLSNGANNNWFRNLYIHNSGGVNIKFGSNNNRIEDSVLTEIGSLNTNEGDSLNLINDADNNIVVRNYFGNAGHGAYSDTLQGDSTRFNENNIVAQNIFDNKNATNIILGGRSIGTLIECNEVKNASQETVNPTLIYPRPGIQNAGDNGIIRYNYIHHNKSYGMIIQGYIFATTQEQYPENNQFYHNTVVGNGSAGLLIGASDAGYPNAHAYVRNNTFENNIFWNDGGLDGANGQLYDIAADFYNSNYPWVAGFTDGNVFRYNNTSTLPFFVVIRRPASGGNLFYETPALAQATIPSWTNNTQIDPLFTNTSGNNYTLLPGSPMIDTGRIIPGVTYNGIAPDKGAFETGGVTPSTQTPYPGPNPPNIPLTLEAENFDNGGQGIAYNDTFGSTGSSAYRSNPVEAVDVQARSTASNGYVVFEAAAGEWLKYTINVPVARKYDIGVRYASEFNNGTFHIEIDGVNVTQTMTVASTGNWGVFRNLTKRGVMIAAGTHVVRLVMDTNSPDGCNCIVGNFDAIRFNSTLFDFDNDGRADISVFRPSANTWYLDRSTTGFTAVSLGASADIVTPADFDGDGKTDVAVWRPSNGTWYRFNSSNGGFVGVQFGQNGDIPVQADYDGDGKADTAVFRPSNGGWYYLKSSDGSFVGAQFGQNNDKPAVGDYDGDGKSDLAVFRPSTGSWYIINSSNAVFTAVSFGAASDNITPADYDGDGKTDIAVFRPSNGSWYLQRSLLGFTGAAFGQNGDTPVPANYDGDGKADIAIFRPSTGVWSLLRSTEGGFNQTFGQSGDVPISSTYVR